MPSVLFTPLQIGPLTLQNRVVVSPMCQYSAVDGSANEWHLQHLTSLGYSGAGLVMVEATGVESRGRITHGCLGLFSDANAAALKPVIEIAKRYACGAHFGIQLAHAGRKASAKRPWEGGKPLTAAEGAWQAVAPSALALDEGWPVPQALQEKEMQQLVYAFVQAAERAVRIGFDVIEIHSAHGYLLHEFLSPLANQRPDKYGGGLDNRMRFPCEVVQAVRKVLPKTVVLGVRMSASDWIEGGFTLDEAVIYAQQLKALGVDYICASSGGIIHRVTIPVGPGYQVPFATAIRQRAGIITRAVGMIRQPELAEEIVANGQADCVALARAFLDDPRWVWHAADRLGASVSFPPQYALARMPQWASGVHNRSMI